MEMEVLVSIPILLGQYAWPLCFLIAVIYASKAYKYAKVYSVDKNYIASVSYQNIQKEMQYAEMESKERMNAKNATS
jgi:predicted negative regulator of RcsB-dependent stress response